METPNTLHPSGVNFRMVDVSEKQTTSRRAVATGVLWAAQDTVRQIRERTLPKGDVLALAEVAGVQGAKNCAQWLPLCHPLHLSSVRLWCELQVDSVRVFCEVKTEGKTGVEMEALTGVQAALLCIYDLTKNIDPVLKIGDVQLLLKEGGKSGVWKNPQAPLSLTEKTEKKFGECWLRDVKTSVVVLSDRCFEGLVQDESGVLARKLCEEQGAVFGGVDILPDEEKQLLQKLETLVKEGVEFIVLTGGTGLSPRDITPETVLNFANQCGGRVVPGIGEMLRLTGVGQTKKAYLSRSLGVLCQNSFIVALPGSRNGVEHGINQLAPLVKHLLHVSKGGRHL